MCVLGCVFFYRNTTESRRAFNCTFIVLCPAYVPVSAARFNSSQLNMSKHATNSTDHHRSVSGVQDQDSFNQFRISSPELLSLVLTRLYEAKQLTGDARLKSTGSLM